MRRIARTLSFACLLLLLTVGLFSCALPDGGEGETCVATFVVGDTTRKVTLTRGETPVYPDGTPTLPPTETTEFVFIGWSPALGEMTGDRTYTAQFEERARDLTAREDVVAGGFAPYLARFRSARESGTLQISSEDEFLRFSEFVRFYNIGEPITLHFSGGYSPAFQSRKELGDYLQSLFSRGEFPNGFGLSYTYTSTLPYTPTSLCSTADIAEEGTRVADPAGAGLYTQYEHIGRLSSVGRDEGFDDFPIGNVIETLEVETSNQLVYALEHGYRPLPVVGSVAERVYLAAKAVLRRIVDDGMDDFDKLRAIYEWLILTVRYDHAATGIDEDWRYYDAWYPEGVFFRHTAVCDGIAKSFLILARIENIACIRVSGQVRGGGGHAWNKVYLRGAWYGVDATHGNFSGGGAEYLTYTSFLFSDAYQSLTCDFTVDPATATPERGIGSEVYARTVFVSDAGRCDLQIDSERELELLAATLKTARSEAGAYDGVTSHAYATVEVMIGAESGVTPEAVCRAFGTQRYFSETGEGGAAVYVFLIPLAEGNARAA